MRLVALRHSNWVTFGVRRRMLMNSKMEFPIPSTGTFTFGPAERGKTDQVDLTIHDPTTDTYSTRSCVPCSGWSFSSTFPVLAICVKKIRTISGVEVPRSLVTLLALSSSGFFTRQRNSTIMLQLCQHFRRFQACFHPTESVRAAPCEWGESFPAPSPPPARSPQRARRNTTVPRA